VRQAGHSWSNGLDPTKPVTLSAKASKSLWFVLDLQDSEGSGSGKQLDDRPGTAEHVNPRPISLKELWPAPLVVVSRGRRRYQQSRVDNAEHQSGDPGPSIAVRRPLSALLTENRHLLSQIRNLLHWFVLLMTLIAS
jgi:hypothetical protein